MADHTNFCKSKFPPNCEPQCKKHGKKCVKDSNYNYTEQLNASLLVAVQARSNSNNSSAVNASNASNVDNGLDFLKTKEFRDEYNSYLNTLIGNDRAIKDCIELYQLVTSDNFIKLLESFDFKADKRLNAYGLVKDLFDRIKERLRGSHNTDYKMLTPRNVIVTEDIESLGISDFASIQRLFTDINYHRKYSSSPSLVFNAKLAGGGNNAVKARNSLKPGQMFFFKCFPVGTQKIEEVDADIKIISKNITYGTEALQTEIKLYSELLKLVKYNITPNILCKIASSENIKGLEQFLLDTGMMRDSMHYTFNKEINKDRLNVPPGTVWETVSLISTHKGGEELKDVFPSLDIEERRQVMFQILYNMYVFDKLEISQGDLHSGNILINVLPEEIELCYVLEGGQYRFRTKHLVKYFDWDFGMIGKTTTLRFDKNQTAQINQVDNPMRESDKWINMDYAATSIYNKNLELVILITHPDSGLLTESTTKGVFSFTYLDKPDEEFNKFMNDVMPGGNSNKTIIDTYTELLQNPAEKAEADRIFGVVSPKKKKEKQEKWIQRSITNYAIEDVKNKTWKEYFEYIGTSHIGRIIKSIISDTNNHLWIPDTIILSKIDMLKNTYFNKFISHQVFDITEEIIYTIDGMI